MNPWAAGIIGYIVGAAVTFSIIYIGFALGYRKED
jgi:hypothetical protein